MLLMTSYSQNAPILQQVERVKQGTSLENKQKPPVLSPSSHKAPTKLPTPSLEMPITLSPQDNYSSQ